MKKTVSIIGFGRFGKVLSDILRGDFNVNVFDQATQQHQENVNFVALDKALMSTTIFIAVPIRDFEAVIKQISPHVSHQTTIIDVCSVKVHPVKVMQQHLPQQVGIIATHPLFGPDSVASQSKCKIMMHATRDSHHQYEFWKDYFSAKKLSVVEMTPEQHDQQAAVSQGITHFLGRSLLNFGIKPTQIDTKGFASILEVVKQTSHDSEALFVDLQRFNPYSNDMIERLTHAIDITQSLVNKETS